MFEFTVTADLHNGETRMVFVHARNEDEAYAALLHNEGLAAAEVEGWDAVLGF